MPVRAWDEHSYKMPRAGFRQPQKRTSPPSFQTRSNSAIFFSKHDLSTSETRQAWQPQRHKKSGRTFGQYLLIPPPKIVQNDPVCPEQTISGTGTIICVSGAIRLSSCAGGKGGSLCCCCGSSACCCCGSRRGNSPRCCSNCRRDSRGCRPYDD